MRLIPRLAIALACSWLVHTQAPAQNIVFDFDNAPLHTSLPINLTVEGVTAHCSASPAYYNYSIQRADALGFTPAGFSGYCIYPNTVFKCDLLISFDRALSSVALLYAPQELALDTSCTMRITAYFGARYVGTQTHVLNPDGNTAWPSDVLSIATSEPFTSVVIHYDKPPPNTQENWGPIFMADNLVITPWTAPYARIDSLGKDRATGYLILRGVSVPFATITVEATGTLAQPFSFLGNASASADGSFEFADSEAQTLSSRFYRVTYP